MSSSIDYFECPKCGGQAHREQDNRTCEIYFGCSQCDWAGETVEKEDRIKARPKKGKNKAMAKKKETSPVIKCDFCKKRATRNYQKVWIKWAVSKNGDYSDKNELMMDMDEPTGEDNVHTCDEHGDRFEQGEELELD